MQNGTHLYALDISGASFVRACGGPCTEGCVTLARIGESHAGAQDGIAPAAVPAMVRTRHRIPVAPVTMR